MANLKLSEVARRLGVSERTARRYVRAGELPSVYVGNSYRVSEEDLEKYLEAARVEPGDGSGKGRSPQPKFRAAAQPKEWQERLARLYEAAIEEGREALRTPKPDFDRVRVFDKFAARAADLHGPRDILGREADTLADAVEELEDVQDQIQTRLQEWFVAATEDEQSAALEQVEGTVYEESLRAVR